MNKILDAIEKLEQRKKIEEKALLGLSGGKDSMVCLDLAFKVYEKKNIVPFYMEFMPDLDIADRWLEPAIKKYKLKEIKRYPAEAFWKAYKHGWYGWEEDKSIPDISRKEIYEYISRENKINTIILGVKSIDAVTIRTMVNHNRAYSGAIYPIWDWTFNEVMAYIKSNDIELSQPALDVCRGLDVKTETLMYLDKHYPQDLDKIEKVFPFIRADVFRIKHYDLKVNFKRV